MRFENSFILSKRQREYRILQLRSNSLFKPSNERRLTFFDLPLVKNLPQTERRWRNLAQFIHRITTPSFGHSQEVVSLKKRACLEFVWEGNIPRPTRCDRFSALCLNAAPPGIWRSGLRAQPNATVAHREPSQHGRCCPVWVTWLSLRWTGRDFCRWLAQAQAGRSWKMEVKLLPLGAPRAKAIR